MSATGGRKPPGVSPSVRCPRVSPDASNLLKTRFITRDCSRALVFGLPFAFTDPAGVVVCPFRCEVGLMRKRYLGLLMILILTVLALGVVKAQEQPAPAVGRVSLIDGDVLIQRAGSGEWVA